MYRFFFVLLISSLLPASPAFSQSPAQAAQSASSMAVEGVPLQNRGTPRAQERLEQLHERTGVRADSEAGRLTPPITDVEAQRDGARGSARDDAEHS